MFLLVVAALRESIWGMLSTLCSFFGCKNRPPNTHTFFMQTAYNQGVNNVLKTILQSYTPSPWAKGPLAQTVFGNCCIRTPTYPYTRCEYVLFDDDVMTSLYWTEPNTNAPIVLICHGIGGSHHSEHPRLFSKMVADMGLRAVVYNRRGHDMCCSLYPIIARPDFKPYPLHCDTEDMHAVMKHIRTKYLDVPILAVGISAGANLMVEYMAKYRDARPFEAAVSIANGCDLVQLTHGFSKKPYADVIMLNALKTFFHNRSSEVLTLCKERNIHIDVSTLHKSKSVRDFEKQLILPLYQDVYDDLDDYYEQHSCYERFEDIDVPFLSIGSYDDPLIDTRLHDHVIRASYINPNLFTVMTDVGGHLGWLSGWRGSPIHSDLVRAFLEYVIRKPK
jgi:uncharacterized protein